MAQVPYSPVPSQTLSEIPTPEMKPAIPAAAFGGEVGQALSKLGTVTEGAGNEIFARAIALQNLQNETDAKEADAKYMIDAGKLHANYSALEGKAAVDAYPKYTADLQKLRIDTRESLPTAMSQKMYDSSSLSTMGRSIFNGAGHAATEQKKYVVNTATANMDLDAKSVEDNPQDPRLFEDKLRRTERNAATVAAAHGFGEAQEKDLLLKATSKLWSQRIIGLSRTDPFTAAKELDDAKTNLTQDDYLKVDNTVRATSRAVGSTQIANEIFNAGKAGPDKAPASFSDMEKEVRAKAKDLNPDDPLLEQHAVSQLHSIYNQQKYAQRQEQGANMETINKALHDGVVDYQTFRANPQLAAAEDALYDSGKKINIPGMINTYNAARDKADNESHFRTLMGQSNNDVLGFLDQNPYEDKHLSQGQMNQIVARQSALKKQVGQDPQVDRAMSWLRQGFGSQMQALGTYSRTKTNTEDYDHLTGTVQDAMSIWAEQHQGKQPTQKEFDEQIAPKVIQQRSEKGWLWNTNKPFYNQDTPDDFAEKVKAHVIAKGGVEPTPEELNRAYVRMQLLKLYPGKAKSSE